MPEQAERSEQAAHARGLPNRLLIRLVGFHFILGVALAGVVALDHSWLAVAAALLAYVGLSAWLGSWLLGPLSRMIQKALSPGGPGESIEDASGEWEELEDALDRMRSDLREKADALTQERMELGVLMAGISDAIVAIDGEGRLLFFNTRFAVLFGGGNLVQRRSSIREVFRAPEVIDPFFSVLASGSGVEVSCEIHPVGEAQLRSFNLAITPLRRDSGEVYGAVGVFHDVTELRKAERMRIDFVANVSHELRTPLTAIMGYTETLRQDIEARRYDDVGQFVGVISRNSERLLALIEDLLDLSTLESGKELDLQWLDTAEVTRRVLGQLESKRVAKQMKVECRFDSPQVLADARRLEQVLVNLIDNAFKYVPIGGTVWIDWVPGKAGGTELRVIDSGPGIPADSIERLFERFYRIDKARSREIGGTGLGLAIVKHILQGHGGTVRVRNVPGQGAEFTCEFPAAQKNDSRV